MIITTCEIQAILHVEHEKSPTDCQLLDIFFHNNIRILQHWPHQYGVSPHFAVNEQLCVHINFCLRDNFCLIFETFRLMKLKSDCSSWSNTPSYNYFALLFFSFSAFSKSFKTIIQFNFSFSCSMIQLCQTNANLFSTETINRINRSNLK